MTINEEEELKKLIEQEAIYYLTGIVIDSRNNKQKPVGIRDVAKRYGRSVPTVHDDLSRKLLVINCVLYADVSKKLEDSKSSKQSISEPSVIKRVLIVYNKLVNENKYLEDIAQELGQSIYIIYNDITIRLRQLHNVDPKTVTKDMLDKVAEALAKHRSDNLEPGTGRK